MLLHLFPLAVLAVFTVSAPTRHQDERSHAAPAPIFDEDIAGGIDTGSFWVDRVHDNPRHNGEKSHPALDIHFDGDDGGDLYTDGIWVTRNHDTPASSASSGPVSSAPAFSSAISSGPVSSGAISSRPIPRSLIFDFNPGDFLSGIFRRDAPSHENECYHGRTARTLNEDEPELGGAVGCIYSPDPSFTAYKLIPGDEGAAIQNVSIVAEFESMNPLRIKMTVNNTTPLPITFWKEWSPLSKRGWELGQFSVETEIWGHFFGRVGNKYPMALLGGDDIPKRPGSIDELVQLNPGESISEVITIPYCEPKENADSCRPYMWDRWTEMLRLGGIRRIFVQGDWYGIWAQPKDQVMANMVDNPMEEYWTRWWADNVLFPTPEQNREFGTYLPLMEAWYQTESALQGGHSNMTSA